MRHKKSVSYKMLPRDIENLIMDFVNLNVENKPRVLRELLSSQLFFHFRRMSYPCIDSMREVSEFNGHWKYRGLLNFERKKRILICVIELNRIKEYTKFPQKNQKLCN